mmetsp:Transcript_57119/g.107310  ORF Transcript_57119/g.107310 Transcript_57119/m.107310 type:complete len:219 (+) Transcript_57119:463-1119(+)
MTRLSRLANCSKKSECRLVYVSTTTSSLSGHVCASKHFQSESWNLCLDSDVGVTTETRPFFPPAIAEIERLCSPNTFRGCSSPSVQNHKKHSRVSQSRASFGNLVTFSLLKDEQAFCSRAFKMASISTSACRDHWQPQHRHRKVFGLFIAKRNATYCGQAHSLQFARGFPVGSRFAASESRESGLNVAARTQSLLSSAPVWACVPTTDTKKFRPAGIF